MLWAQITFLSLIILHAIYMIYDAGKDKKDIMWIIVLLLLLSGIFTIALFAGSFNRIFGLDF